MNIPIPDALTRFASTPKRFKIMIGGRGSAKSETIAALFAGMVYQAGCRAVCCREFQTSIKQSVHNLVKRKIEELDFDGFSLTEQRITHANGGDILYQGLARDPNAIKSIDEAELCWVEEAQTLSSESLKQLTPSIRGHEGEIWMSANLGSSKDPFSQRFIKPFEKELRKNRYYEDDLHMIVWINYDQNPWFPPELEAERAHDKETLSTAAYDHKWLGEFNDEVENALIAASHFDACVDAHLRLGWGPRGIEVVSHDPSDMGSDDKGLAYRHGCVILDVQSSAVGDINEGADWAIDYALKERPDRFVWDGDGMGAGLKRQFRQAFEGKRIQAHAFHGGGEPYRPDSIYDPGDEGGQRKTNKQTFKNLRAQCYWDLRDRCRRTWEAVNGKYIDPDELISFSSDIEGIDLLRAELCGVPQKHNGSGVLQVMTKPEMRKLGIASPNMADSVMMAFGLPAKKKMPALDLGKLNRFYKQPLSRGAMAAR